MVINDFIMDLFWNVLEYKNVDRREKQWVKGARVKKETVKKSVFIHLII